MSLLATIGGGGSVHEGALGLSVKESVISASPLLPGVFV